MRTFGWYIIDYLLNTALWLAVCIAAILIISIVLYMRWGKFANISIIFWGFITFIILIVVFVIFVIASNYIANDLLYRPSRVNVSSIATLNENSSEQVEEAFLQLASQGYLREPLHIREFPEDHRSRIRSYTAGWISQSPRFPRGSSSLSIRLIICRYDEQAASVLQQTGRLNPHHVYIQNDNNTDAILLYPWMPVSAGGWYIPSNQRRIRTEIRIGNIAITFTENRRWHDMRNDYTSQFIDALVREIEKLQAD